MKQAQEYAKATQATPEEIYRAARMNNPNRTERRAMKAAERKAR